MALLALFLMLPASAKKTASAKNLPSRQFISHRGVHLNRELCGENSLEALEFAKLAGFQCVETDCHYTKDSVLVILHDRSLNRTFTNVDGSPIEGEVLVADHTLADLRANYRYQSARPEYRVAIQTLEEHLQRCRELGFVVFIEPKLNDPTGKYYLDIIAIADRILGRDKYIITSNNFANDVIRNTLGIKDVRLMGLLYQTDYSTMAGLGNTIFAISSTAFSREDFAANMARAEADGFASETSCCLRSQKPQVRFETTDVVETLSPRAGYISTDFSAPDWHGQGKVVMTIKGKGCRELNRLSEYGRVGFGAIYFEAEIDGPVEVNVVGDKFKADSKVKAGNELKADGKSKSDGKVQDGKKFKRDDKSKSDGTRTIVYRRMICDQVPEVEIEGAVKKFKVRVVEYSK